ncbi:hypothetical protein EKK58_08325 [Candidatus Dependentiae bacterium]|nr:MAG: hypothetical protein EKK58_08325 [Candidatus Dependentiae bacterium]
MKKYLLLLTFLVPTLLYSQQIPVTTQQQSNLKNLLVNAGFENGAVGVSTIGSGTISVQTTTVLSGKNSLQFSLPAAGSGFQSSLYSVPKYMQGQRCYLQFNFGSTSAVGVLVGIFDQTGTEVTSAIERIDLPVVAGFSAIRTEFTCPSSGSIRYRFTRLNNSPTGFIDDVIIGLVYPSETTKWQEFTPTFTGLGTVTSVKAFWRKVGENLEVYGRGTAGTPTASGSTINFSSLGVTINSTLIVTDATHGQIFGNFGTEATRSAGYHIGARNDFTNYVYVGRQESNGALRDTDGTNLIGTGERFSFKFSVPIKGW